MGFCFIRLKGLTNKNKLEKAGFDLNKSYKSGYYIDASDLFEEPDYIKSSGDHDIRVMWRQSLALKEIAGRVACEMLKNDGIDCWLDSMVD